jgi:hypothetical protein
MAKTKPQKQADPVKKPPAPPRETPGAVAAPPVEPDAPPREEITVAVRVFLRSLTVAELRAVASGRGIDPPRGSTRRQIIELLARIAQESGVRP